MRVAIIGAGRASGEHAKAYIACGVEVVAVCGRTIASARQKIKELEIGATPYDDLDSMMRSSAPDIVSICSPPELHAEHVIKAVTTNYKKTHLAIEKPVALSKRELQNIHRAIASRGVKTVVGFVLRWNDLVRNITMRKSSGDIGRVNYIETDYWHGSSHEKEHIIHEYGTRARPIGAFLGGGCHAVDMARYLMESDIVEVTAITPKHQESDLQRTTAALMKFENGAIGKISATDEIFMPYEFNINLFGDEGVIRLNRLYSRHSVSKNYEIIEGVVPDSGAVWHHPFKGMIQEFVDCIDSGRETTCSLAESLNTHLVCFAVEESASRGGV